MQERSQLPQLKTIKYILKDKSSWNKNIRQMKKNAERSIGRAWTLQL